jgi:predicted nucleotidyltransferase
MDCSAATIADERLRRPVTTIVNALHPKEIWLFGGRARGDAHEDGDYDLFVVVPDETPREEILVTSTYELAHEARVPADIIGCWRRTFEEDKDEIGGLLSHGEGSLIYDESGRPLA